LVDEIRQKPISPATATPARLQPAGNADASASQVTQGPQDQANLSRPDFEGFFRSGAVDAEMHLPELHEQTGKPVVDVQAQLAPIQKQLDILMQALPEITSKENAPYIGRYYQSIDKARAILAAATTGLSDEQRTTIRKLVNFIEVDLTHQTTSDNRVKICDIDDSIDLLNEQLGAHSLPTTCKGWKDRMDDIKGRMNELELKIDKLEQKRSHLTTARQAQIDTLLTGLYGKHSSLKGQLNQVADDKKALDEKSVEALQQSVDQMMDVAEDLARDLEQESQEALQDQQDLARIKQNPDEPKNHEDLQRLLEKYNIPPNYEDADIKALEEEIGKRNAAIEQQAQNLDRKKDQAIDQLPPALQKKARERWRKQVKPHLNAVLTNYNKIGLGLGISQAHLDQMLDAMKKGTFDPDQDAEIGGSDRHTPLLPVQPGPANEEAPIPFPLPAASAPDIIIQAHEQEHDRPARSRDGVDPGAPDLIQTEAQENKTDQEVRTAASDKQVKLQQRQRLEQKVTRDVEERKAVGEQKAGEQAENRLEQAGVRPKDLIKKVHDRSVAAHQEVQQEQQDAKRRGIVPGAEL